MTHALPRMVDSGQEARFIARINALTSAGRTNWFGLLAYLVFAFITVLGVEDADFFIPERQTKLPIVGIEIPTEAFFFFAPILGAALYIYLHLYVRKVTAALCMAPARIKGDGPAVSTPLERHITPWLLNDFVLRRRGDGAIDRRPLDGLASATAVALVWLAGPFVMAAMWIRSWPAHNEAITTLAGLCLAICLYTGWTSYIRLHRDLSGTREVTMFSDLVSDFMILFVAMGLLNLGWVKTESGVPYTRVGKQSASLTGSVSVFFSTIPNLLDPNWWGALTPARLAEVQFSALPPNQADLTAARAAFRERWCKRHGMDAKTCGPVPVPGRALFPNADILHDSWCRERGIEPGQACAAHVSSMDEAFTTEWTNLRISTLAALPKPDLREADLRGADLSNASLVGIVLRHAQLQGANASGANMEGADLEGALLSGANLTAAQLDNVNFFQAQIQQTDFDFASLRGSSFVFAGLQGSSLSLVELNGAKLMFADLMALDLTGTSMLDVEWARYAPLTSALHGADLRRAPIAQETQAALSTTIGDARTLLPERTLDGSSPWVCTCWTNLPEHWNAGETVDLGGLTKILCEDGTSPLKTGTPWPKDKQKPWGDFPPWSIEARTWAARPENQPTSPCF